MGYFCWVTHIDIRLSVQNLKYLMNGIRGFASCSVNAKSIALRADIEYSQGRCIFPHWNFSVMHLLGG